MARRNARWRWWLGAAGALILVGGPQHPGGTMAQMLGDPAWVPAHLMMCVAMAALLAGLRDLARGGAGPGPVRRWLRWATVGTAVELLDMALHTAAALDHANLVAGRATPVLSTHLALAAVCSPLFGVTVAGFTLAAGRARAVGSPWLAPLGAAGSLAYGLAPPLMRLFPDAGLRVLFPLVLLLGLWLVLVAVWAPSRAAVALEGA